MAFQIKAKILFNKQAQGHYFHCALKAGRIASSAKPGQFVNVRVHEGSHPLLRRPFGIHRVKADVLEIIYEVLGKGTELLSQKKGGEVLDILGPLGSGFDYNLQARSPVLVAGGVGVAPLLFLAERIKAQGRSKRWTVLIGAKTKNRIPCESEFKKLGAQVKIATDDGSRGFKGYVSELLKQILRQGTGDRGQGVVLYACGPRPMLREVALISRQLGIPAQVSLEEHMACGIGACLGCVTAVKDGHKRVCQEGPVFSAEEILWDQFSERENTEN